MIADRKRIVLPALDILQLAVKPHLRVKELVLVDVIFVLDFGLVGQL